MKGLKTMLSWLISIILVVSLFVLLIIINVSNFFKEESMINTVTNIDITHEIAKIQNSSATSANKAEIIEIINMAYDEAEKHAIPKTLVDTIFNSDETKEFLGKIVGNTTDNLINNTDKKPVTSADFNQLLDTNIDNWIKQSGIELSDSKKEVLLIRMKSVGAGIINNLPTSDSLTDKISENTKEKIQFIFSPKIKIGLIIICLLSVILLFILKRKKAIWLLYLGTSLLITGLGIIGISLIINDALTYALSQYNLSFIISTVSDALSQNVMQIGIIVVVISIILYIIHGYYKKSKSVL